MIKTIIGTYKSMSVGAKIISVLLPMMMFGAVSTIAYAVVSDDKQSNAGSVVVQNEITETYEIPFEKIEEKSDVIDEGITEVKQEGKNGSKSIVFLVTYDTEGNEVSREKLSEEVEEPVNQVVLIGAKKKVSNEKTQASNNTNNSSTSNATNEVEICHPPNITAECSIDFRVVKTRAAFNAAGGWEKAVQDIYMNHLYNVTTYGESYYKNSVTGHYYMSQSGLCYSSLSLDVTTMTILDASWDDEITPTCDSVRNEHPPIPSLEYLNSYLRRVVAADCYIGGLGELKCRKSI